MTDDDVLADHNAHLAALDRALPPAPPLDPAEGDRLLRVSRGGATGQGLARTSRVAADADEALWTPLTSHSLEARLAGPDRAAALAGLLDEWLAGLARTETAGDWESAASVTVPSRDAELVAPLLAHGFAPVGIVALRTAGSSATGPAASAGRPGVRFARESDLDRIAELDERLLHHDSRFGVVNVRPGARARLRAGLAHRLALAPGWTWVLERDGVVTGFVHLLPPGTTGWFAGQSSYGESAGFLVSIFVDPAERGAGAGALLVQTAHEALDAAGAAATVLDYAVANPVSPAFWSRMGYRPLWTTWRRRPAILAR